MAVLVQVRRRLAPDVDRQLGWEAPLAASRTLHRLHDRLTLTTRRRRDQFARDSVEDNLVLDRIEHLVLQQSLMAREHAISRCKVSANARSLVVLCTEQDALGNADTDRNLVHQVLNEAFKGCARPRRHHLDLVRAAEVSNVADVAQFVFLRLTVRERRRRRRREQVSAVGSSSVRKHEGGLLASKADAHLFSLKNLVEHPRRRDRSVEVSNAAILVNAKWIVIMAEELTFDVFRIIIDALSGHAEDSIRHRTPEVVREDALEVVGRIGAERVRIPDARARHKLDLQLAVNATNDEAAVAVNWALLGCKLDQLLKRVPVRDVARLAPFVKVVTYDRVILPVTRRRRILVRRQVVAELATDLARFREILLQIPRFPHHHDAVANGRVRFRRQTVLLRRVEAVRLRCVVAKQRRLHARLHALQSPSRRNCRDCLVVPRRRSDDL